MALFAAPHQASLFLKDSAMSSPTIIPAQPGYFVVTKEHRGSGYWADPIVAWAVRELHGGTVYPLPVTLEDGERDDNCCILRPDGRVSDGNKAWGTLADWLNDAGALA